MAPGEKEESAGDWFAFEPPRKVWHIIQGDVPDTPKTQLRSAVGDRRKLSSAD
jgi:hypothetical protein